MNRIACAEKVLTDEKGEDINKMGVERDLLERQVINWQEVSPPVLRAWTEDENLREARLAICLSGWNSLLEDSSKCCWTKASERILDERTLK